MEKAHKPLVSFVVLSYNRARYLGDCIESILNQDGDYDFEVVVVDDASTDGSDTVAGSYTDPRIHFIRHPRNLGHAFTVYDGIMNSSGTYIARIDGDDCYRPHFLKDTLRVFHKFPEVGLVYGNVALIDEKGKIICEPSGSLHEDKDFKGDEFVKLLEHNYICSATVIARRQGWLDALPVPANLIFHDWYFTLMIARRYESYYINSVIADYRVHPANLHSVITKDKSEESSIFWLLNLIFSESEADSKLEEDKQRRKRVIYAAQYLSLADKYFGFYMNADALRCYLKALWYRPAYVTNAGLIRRFLGLLIGRKVYESAKSIAKTAYSRIISR